MNRNVLIIVVIILILGIGAFLFLNKKTQLPASQTAEPTPTTTNSPTTVPDEDTSSETEAVENVSLTPSGFSPASITIQAGTKVVWTNNSGTLATIDSDPHPVHTSYRPLNLEEFADGETLSLTFTEPGTYHYHDHLNPNFQGTIIVK